MPSAIDRLTLVWLPWVFAASVCGGPLQDFSFHVAGDEPGAWPQILSSVGLVQGVMGPSRVAVLPAGAPAPPEQWIARIESGLLVVLEGDSELAAALGFRPEGKRLPVRNVVDLRMPELEIIWEKPVDLTPHTLPAEATVLAKERWSGMPLMASLKRGGGAVLWLAASPGREGYERFPYLLQAMSELGLTAPLRSNRLWAFFDSSYRARVDPDYFASRWRKAGIAGLHVAAWHFFDPDEQRDGYLEKLIDACHRQAILVYAWLELPHVSERFWEANPQWREKTALLQDAHLDWRKLMNLQSRDCFRAASSGVRALIERFDWDGVNVAELYFESLEGAANPARFTPMNDDVRREFEAEAGFDPIAIFRNRGDGLKAFLDFRARLAERMQSEWMAEMRQIQKRKPHLELVLTHVDDRFDTRMRDLIGADAARVLPELDRGEFTFLIEDPATIWHLGPGRYAAIAEKYARLTPHRDRLGIDINIVDRYQDVYPTKQQTGTELFRLVHKAASTFPRVALYFENSILKEDLGLLPFAGASATRLEEAEGRLVVETRTGAGVRWKGPASVNGKIWPIYDGESVWVPAGLSAIEEATNESDLRIVYFNGGLRTATVSGSGIELSYVSASRAIAVLDRRPEIVEVDGVEEPAKIIASGHGHVLFLPRGQHVVRISSGGPANTPSIE